MDRKQFLSAMLGFVAVPKVVKAHQKTYPCFRIVDSDWNPTSKITLRKFDVEDYKQNNDFVPDWETCGNCSIGSSVGPGLHDRCGGYWCPQSHERVVATGISQDGKRPIVKWNG